MDPNVYENYYVAAYGGAYNSGSPTPGPGVHLGTSYQIVAGVASHPHSNSRYHGWLTKTTNLTDSDARPVANRAHLQLWPDNLRGNQNAPAPSDQPYAGEAWSDLGVWEVPFGGDYGPSRFWRNNHAQGSNTLFADGHVSFRSADDFQYEMYLSNENLRW